MARWTGGGAVAPPAPAPAPLPAPRPGGMLERRQYGRRENNSQQTCPNLKATATTPLHQAILDFDNFPRYAGLYKLFCISQMWLVMKMFGNKVVESEKTNFIY